MLIDLFQRLTTFITYTDGGSRYMIVNYVCTAIPACFFCTLSALVIYAIGLIPIKLVPRLFGWLLGEALTGIIMRITIFVMWGLIIADWLLFFACCLAAYGLPELLFYPLCSLVTIWIIHQVWDALFNFVSPPWYRF